MNTKPMQNWLTLQINLNVNTCVYFKKLTILLDEIQEIKHLFCLSNKPNQQISGPTATERVNCLLI